jgi:hypothetical protein
MSTRVDKNEWTPQFRKMRRGLSPASRNRRLVKTGYKVVALLKVKMTKQKGFSDDAPYRKLKIKYRYHGQKDVIASKKNIARRARGAQVRRETFTRSGGQTLLDSRSGRVIRITNKTKVTDSTKAVIDTAATRNSWDVLASGPGYVDVGNLTPFEKLKAYYNDDRVHADWGRISTEEALAAYMADFDRQMGFA